MQHSEHNNGRVDTATIRSGTYTWAKQCKRSASNRLSELRTLRTREPDKFDPLEAERLHGQLDLLNALIVAHEPLQTEFAIDSWPLAEAFHYACRDDREQLVLLAGISIGHVRVATTCLPLACRERTATYAAADKRELAQSVQAIVSQGHFVVGLLHSHPGVGAEATVPSYEDLATHRTWDACCPLLSGIFSRDGYCRFFVDATKQPDVRLFGTGFKKIASGLFRYQHA